uniref:Uncharacterized protein n=1 Tax=Klebsiella pneumoniae TaxID=573 RepID=A0A6G9HNI7_KLEPN|nr:hypothetical protein [Klebsiella pneumoniae]
MKSYGLCYALCCQLAGSLRSIQEQIDHGISWHGVFW